MNSIWLSVFFLTNSIMHSSSLQSSVLHSQPKSTVGTPAYIAPEVLLKREYDGKVFMLSLSLFILRNVTLGIGYTFASVHCDSMNIRQWHCWVVLCAHCHLVGSLKTFTYDFSILYSSVNCQLTLYMRKASPLWSICLTNRLPMFGHVV